ncbi:MAG: DUF1828 domain-containing protein [Clostridia bacterium]|nr:DUF1828 domain-containing protein [Clostridia bacterium]
MTERDVLLFIKLRKSISVAEFQKITNFGFSASKNYLLGLVEDGVLKTDDGIVFDYIFRAGEPVTIAEEGELERNGKILDKMYKELHTVDTQQQIYEEIAETEEAVAEACDDGFISSDDEEDLDMDSDAFLESCSEEKRILSSGELASVGNGITLDAVKARLADGFKTYEKSGECWLSCGAVFPDGSPFKLGVKGLGAGIVFSDLGSTAEYLEKKRSVKGLGAEIEDILSRYGVSLIDGELIIKIRDVKNAFGDFISLYSASLLAVGLE